MYVFLCFISSHRSHEILGLTNPQGISQRANFNSPILLTAAVNPTAKYPDEWNVKNFGSNSSIRVIVNNLTPVAHPMHLHGHNMQILGEGIGPWGSWRPLTNLQNPQRRDVQMLRPYGYMVWQIDADNPGVCFSSFLGI